MIRKFKISISIAGPILTAATEAGAFGVDKPALRDQTGRFIISGSHLIGKLKDALFFLQKVAGYPVDSERIFGIARPGDGDGWKTLHLSDFLAEYPTKCSTENKPIGFRTRIEISPSLGTAEDRALQVNETPFYSGETVHVSGLLTLLGNSKEIQRDLESITAGFQWLSQLGGNRTVGFGRVLSVEISETQRPSQRKIFSRAKTKPEAERWQVRLKMRDPFCISTQKADGNLFPAKHVVSGGLLKAIFARLLLSEHVGAPNRNSMIVEDKSLNRQSILATYFSQIRLTHFFPSSLQPTSAEAIRPFDDGIWCPLKFSPQRQWPLSLAMVDDCLFDLALSDGPGFIDSKAPAFVHDWKANVFQGINETFGIEKPKTFLRVRTAMDGNQRTAAKNQLFSYEMVVPDHHIWLGYLDLGETTIPADRRQEIVDELAGLAQNGLIGIGKTHSRADLYLRPAEADPLDDWTEEGFANEKDSAGPPQWVLVLRTPALLVSPKILDHLENSDSVSRLKAAYRKSFLELSGNRLELTNLFTWHFLSGGVFQASRYMRGRTYKPWLLTEVGSTFVVQPTPPYRSHDALRGIRQMLRDWRRGGLPIPLNIRQFYELDPHKPDASLWRQCPYIRQNGYGEIIINMPEHRDWSPNKRFTPIDMV